MKRTIEYDECAAAFERLGGVRHGDSTRGPCPAHGSGNPSTLSITRRAGTEILIHCFAEGCSYRDVLDALGFEDRVLYEVDSYDLDKRLRRNQYRRLVGFQDESFAVRAMIAFLLRGVRFRLDASRLDGDTYKRRDSQLRKVWYLRALEEQLENFVDRLAEMRRDEVWRFYARAVHRWDI